MQPHVHEWTGPTGVAFKQIREPSGTYYHHDMPRAVIIALESARASGRRVRIFTGDQETGKCWDDEFDVVGRVSHSMGPIKIPLLIANTRSHGGPAILDQCVIGVQSAPGIWLYRHPSLDLGEWSIGPAHSEGYLEAAFRDGELHAQFKKEGQAARYVAFMRGERWVK